MTRSILLLLCLLLNGCIYNTSLVCGEKNTAAMSPEKTTDLAAQGNVPLQGGTINDPVQK